MTLRTPLNIEELAQFSLDQTGDFCPETMLAQYAHCNPSLSEEELNSAHADFVEFVNNAI